jgi:spiro-SPASM protein
MNDCSDYDDICLTLGGFGEPLAHPQLLDMISAAKNAGIFGINIETDGRALHGELADALLESSVDTISVYLDADSDLLYRQVKGNDGFEAVVNQLETFQEKRNARDNKGPILVAHLVKTHQTMPEMEAFYDRWIRCCGCAVIVGYNDFAGQIEDHSVMNMAPPRRFPCRRLSHCMMILADGQVSICSQDFLFRHSIGNVFKNSVKELWQSEALEQLRKSHQDGNFAANPLCAKCKDWFR